MKFEKRSNLKDTCIAMSEKRSKFIDIAKSEKQHRFMAKS